MPETRSNNTMASNPPSNTTHRSSPLRPVRSFRVERFPSPEPMPRPKRASTIESGPAPGAKSMIRTSSGTQVRMASETERPDVFEGRISEENFEPPRASVDLDDLPIELISLTDRFVDSLTAKVHSVPPNIDKLSQMFQDFYATASSHIKTHVDSLATKQRRDAAAAAPPLSTRASAASLLRQKAASLGSKEKPKAEQQMLTPEELADRKKARKALEQMKGHLEEAVERRLCEGVYSKIYRHRTTQDEAQDAKLRSKTAALAVVNIGPVDLGVDLGTPGNDPEAAIKKQAEVREWLEGARKELTLMSQARYPLRKLNHLKAAFKSIIDTLSHFHPSSSADELMPMLIYTLITLEPENLNVISDSNFIQRFRWEQKLTGEASYCLTTLEATISFLETVDLSTLRADETPTGPAKGAAAALAKGETFPPAFSPTSPAPNSPTAAGSLSAVLKSPSPNGFRATVGQQLRNRRLSDLINTPAQAFNSASDAVLNTADQGLKTIGTSLGDSYKFLLGKLRERVPPDSPNKDIHAVVPKTLEDARKLMETPPPGQADGDDAGSASGASSVHSPEEVERPPLLSLISGSGKKPVRDRSADSARSGGSLSRAAVADEPASKTVAVATGSSPVIASPPIIDSMRSLSNSFNPMARISAGIGGFRGFGRSPVLAPAAPAPAAAPAPPAKDLPSGSSNRGLGVTVDGGDLITAFPDLATVLPPKVTKVAPPNPRFMEMQNAADLKLGEVFELLNDYKRLAGALKEMGAFKG
ncbi:hypothetical protein QBC35DRAFT_479904 [Podospora australis]|uniref:VPS9 domain-containing protein n=1 Tax=Podospora australis TaxID=1536484 RepID=A0AAN7API1_9PEZI|nr:hypothetical protein QBC35DRAFT_479904 [Podospora australis]